ncbi:MAG: RICIN domain-containing protein, partial [Bacteroidales bacterium]|nr:RICIN domain-containing protein [Bacteroidales bacterium]
YNIVVGRSKDIYGPYLDNLGRDMKQGGGKMVVNTYGKAVGAGHFGRFVVDKGVEVMSCHFEADFERSGRSVLSILPLTWKDGWPKAGKKVSNGVFSIQSERRGYALELATDFVRIQQERQAWWNAKPDDPVSELPLQKLSDMESTWPKGAAPARLSDYMLRPNQYWQIEAVDGKGGYLGNPYFKITIKGTTRTLAAGPDMDVIVAENYTGDDTQLWRIEQCTDGTYRLMPKRLAGTTSDNTKFVLYSIADSTPILKEWDNGDNAKWNLVAEEK